MRGEPRKGALRHLNQQISELFESSEISGSLSKSFFDKLRGRLTAVPGFLPEILGFYFDAFAGTFADSHWYRSAKTVSRQSSHRISCRSSGYSLMDTSRTPAR